MQASIPLPAGTRKLYIFVGSNGGNGGIAEGGDGGWNGGGSAGSASAGGGGGGASEIRTSEAITSRLIVAGGGANGNGNTPGGVGGPSGSDPERLGGSDGQDLISSPFSCGGRGGGGGGGTSGAGGSGGSDPTFCAAADGVGGGLLVGGHGGFGPLDAGGGGGGGGYYGGGGGVGGSGGGGSSFATPGAAAVSKKLTRDGSSVEVTYTLPVPALHCQSRFEVTIGQSLDNLPRICTTDVHEGDIKVIGQAPPGTNFFSGPEVVSGPLVLVIGTFSGSVVLGPARDYPITVEAFYTGGEVATAQVTISVLPRPGRRRG